MASNKELETKLNEEIENRKSLEKFTKRLWRDFNDFRTETKKDVQKQKDLSKLDKEQLEIEIKKIEKIKDQILEYTLQIITIVVGILTLIMSIVFLTNYYNNLPELFKLFLVVAIIYFLSVFTYWVYRRTRE